MLRRARAYATRVLSSPQPPTRATGSISSRKRPDDSFERPKHGHVDGHGANDRRHQPAPKDAWTTVRLGVHGPRGAPCTKRRERPLRYRGTGITGTRACAGASTSASASASASAGDVHGLHARFENVKGEGYDPAEDARYTTREEKRCPGAGGWRGRRLVWPRGRREEA